MIKVDKFLISKGLYAVDLESLHKEHHPRAGDRVGYWNCRIDAVWFRRRRGETVACIGYLWDLQDDEPANAQAFLKAHDDGRYGGTTLGRWDGEGYWSSGESLRVQNQHLEILRPMLAAFPAAPHGFDGWWRF